MLKNCDGKLLYQFPNFHTNKRIWISLLLWDVLTPYKHRNSSKMDQSLYTSSTSSSSLPPSLHSSPPLPFPPALSTLPFLLCCEVDLLTTAGSLGEHCKLPQCGLEHCKLPSGVWSRARTVRCPVGSEQSLHCKLPQRGLEQSSGCNRNKGIF